MKDVISSQTVAPVDGDFNRSSSSSLPSILALSILLSVVLLGTLVALAGPWEFLAVTRLLDPLVEGGFVQYHDLGPGFIPGLPEVGYYYMSQDPIDWRLVVVAAVLMTAYPLIKAAQFHLIARVFGSQVSFGTHVSTYLYGDGVDRFMPLGIGRQARVEALARYGVSRNRAYEIVQVQQGFTLFEIVAFALVALSLLGWSGWFSQLFYPILSVAAAYFIITNRSGITLRTWHYSTAFLALARLARLQPNLVLGLAALSLLAFGIVDLAVYVTMTAFDTTVVLLNVEKPVLLMGVVGAYVAARILPLTPGGFGQWELGFATGLYLGGSDVSVAMFTIALCSNILRSLTGILLMWIATRRHEIPVSLGEICDEFFGRGRKVRIDDASSEAQSRQVTAAAAE